MARPQSAPAGLKTDPSFWEEVKKKKQVYLFLLPTFLFLIMFSYYPIVSAFWHSFFEWDGVNTAFVGLRHFVMMFRDEAFVASIPNVFFLALAGEMVALTFPLLAAEVIYNLRRQGTQFFYRVLFVVPMVVPYLVILLLWRFILDANDGLINQFLFFLGLDNLAKPWLASSNTALFSLMLIEFPWVAGLNLLIYLAGLDNIPTSVIDAAAIDGVVGFRRWLRIDIPLILGQIKLIVILTFINQLQRFQMVLVLTQGGPGFSTMVPGMVMYQNAFQFNKMGYASAMGVVLFAVIFIVTYFNNKYVKSAVEYAAD